jgi:hypothetical protein
LPRGGDERAMNRIALLAAGLGATFIFTGCVTESVPDEPKVYGSITTPKAKKEKKPKPVKHEESITEVNRPTRVFQQ